MSQSPDTLSSFSEPSPQRLFLLASELESSPQAVRLRREEKRRIWLSAGVLFADGDGVQIPGPGADNSPTTSYEGGTAPQGGCATGGCHGDQPS